MQAMHIIQNTHFIGRVYEQKRLKEINALPEASIIIVYGRRRVGKTELLEQTYASRQLLKFEGIEGQKSAQQIQHVLRKLAHYTQEPLIGQVRYDNWIQVFELIADKIQMQCTLYFEEVQWLACYDSAFVSALKYVWDNRFRHYSHLKIILCGSSPSFMINQVIHSKALYSRSVYEMHVQPFSLHEMKAFFVKRGQREIMDAYLTIGGIPEYLNRIKHAPSLLVGICNNSFARDSYFSTEYQKIFISSLSENKDYKRIIDLLSKRRFMTRKMLVHALKIHSGGQLTDVLNDLITCGFISKYIPYHQKAESLLTRYCIADRYVDFYCKFIVPIQSDIARGHYDSNPMDALNLSRYQKWLGFAFERYCRENHAIIAQILGFSAVRYRHGVFFNRNTDKTDPGFQVDLVFDRADHVMTICEIKYLQCKVGMEIIPEFERKLLLMPLTAKTSIQKVLISTEGPNDNLRVHGYFDRFIILNDIFLNINIA